MPSNNLIVNKTSGSFLAIDSSDPEAGDVVQILPLSFGKKVSAYWVINTVKGGQNITLQNSPKLFLDLDANSEKNVINGTRLVVNSTPNFANSNLWSIADIPQAIISLCGAFKVLDSGETPYSQVWQPLLNAHQEWSITSIQQLEGKIDKSLLM